MGEQPRWSGASVRRPAAFSPAATSSQAVESWGKPCSRTTGSPSGGPWSRTSKVRPSRWKLFTRSSCRDRSALRRAGSVGQQQVQGPARVGDDAGGGGQLGLAAVSRDLADGAVQLLDQTTQVGRRVAGGEALEGVAEGFGVLAAGVGEGDQLAAGVG